MRITPTEVSLYDPDDYEKIYYIGTKYYKSPEHYQPFGAPTGMFTAVENSIHARRRAPMNPFFSKKAVLRVENVVHEKVKTLCDRLETELKIHQVAPLHHMFNALSIDVASDYVFNRSFDFLHTPTFAREFTVGLQASLVPVRRRFSLGQNSDVKTQVFKPFSLSEIEEICYGN